MSVEPITLTCLLAHPDDESMGTGGLLLKYANEGIRTTLVTATDGQRGWFGAPDEYPGPEALAQIRRQELAKAAETLGLARLEMLGYMDGELDQAEPAEVIGSLVHHLRHERPQVLVTFDPFGAYGHPDHIAISQLAQAAIVAAADPSEFSQAGPSHQVKKLYYFADTLEALTLYEKAFGELVMEIAGQTRRPVGWPAWALTTRLDTSDYVDQIWRAIQCHQSQLPNLKAIAKLSAQERKRLWSASHLYRCYSLVNGGSQLETDLFEGIR